MLPFLYEADHLEVWEDKFFWTKRKRRVRSPYAQAEVLFDDSQKEEEPHREDEEQFEEIRPLGEELVDTLIDLLFCIGFTLPYSEKSKSRIPYAIWQKGVGCNSSMSSSKELDSNRIEILRLLLTMSSKSLYMPARLFHRNLGFEPDLLRPSRYLTNQRRQSHHIHHYMSRQTAGAFAAMLSTKYCSFLGLAS